jgi:phage gpG-like protein
MALQDKGFIKFNNSNQKIFFSALEKAVKQVDDLRFPLGEISRDFYKSQKAIFKLKSPGGYADLSEKPVSGWWEKDEKLREALQTGGYKAWKKLKYGNAYPILRATGTLEKSITTPNSKGSINIIGRKNLIIGTSIKYGIYHDSDDSRKKIPQRKFVFIGPESREFGSKQEFGGRLVRWSNIIESYVEQVLKSQKLRTGRK